MSKHPVLESGAVAGFAAALSFVAAIIADGWFGTDAGGTGAVAALVIGAVFAWRVAEGLISFGIVVLLTQTVEFSSGADLRLVDEFSVAVLILSAALAHRRRIRMTRPGALEVAISVVLGAGLISSLANGVPAHVWVPGLGLFFKSVAVFYMVRAIAPGIGELRRIAGVIFGVGLVIAAIGWMQVVAPNLIRGLGFLPRVDQIRGSVEVVNSVFTHPALYGWLSVFLALFLMARFAILREWWAAALAIALGIGSVFSARRTSLAGMAVGMVVGVARLVANGINAAKTLVAASVLVALLGAISVPLLGNFYLQTLEEYWEPPERIGEVFADKPDASVVRALAPRNALYLGSLAIARDNLPLGAGFGRFGSHMSREVYSPVYAQYALDGVYGLTEANPIAVTDTFWPMILGETGVIGLTGMLAFVTLLTRALWRRAVRATEPMSAAFALGALMMFADAIVRSATSAVFVATPIAYFVLGAAALSLATPDTERGRVGRRGMASLTREANVMERDVPVG